MKREVFVIESDEGIDVGDILVDGVNSVSKCTISGVRTEYERMLGQSISDKIDAIWTFIHIDRDDEGKVTMDNVQEGLEELKYSLKLKFK